MPASITHLIVSQKARGMLSTRRQYTDFSKILHDHKEYMDLGSLGPDLPYYRSLADSGFKLLLDKSDKPMGVDQWSYQLHSKNPNIFPLKLIEIAWRESDPDITEWDEADEEKFAFICGFLTHIAADQIIHPLVNKVAGPYYKGGRNRDVHRECEVYQDVINYHKFFGGNILTAEPNLWCDLNPGFGVNTPIWFRYFLQKGFVEAHSVSPGEGDIEDWVDGTLFVLRGLNNFGPYVKASNDFQAYGENSEKYKNFYGALEYESAVYKAIFLSCVYIQAAFELYNCDNLTSRERDNFLEIVQDADLSSPLQKDIFERAVEKFNELISPDDPLSY